MSSLGLVFSGRRSYIFVEGGIYDTTVSGSKATDDVSAVESSHVTALETYPNSHQSSSEVQASTVHAFHMQPDLTSVLEDGVSSPQSIKMLAPNNPEGLSASLKLAMSQEIVYVMKGKSSSTSVIAEHVEHGRKC